MYGRGGSSECGREGTVWLMRGGEIEEGRAAESQSGRRGGMVTGAEMVERSQSWALVLMLEVK